VTARLCTVEACREPHRARGLCNRHYKRFLAHGDPHHVDNPHAGDNIAIARFTGAADARNSRPRRVDIADTSEIGAAYTRGYDAPDAWRYEQ
jgi:hypothetical protein